MNTLEKIIENKKRELVVTKNKRSKNQLKESRLFLRNCNSLKSSLLRVETSGIIAEYKQKSPSKGIINALSSINEVTKGYTKAGATGLSVLTDYTFFGGTLDNLLKTRLANVKMPILRKDFIIDEYQIVESKAFGADIILLIAACLTKSQAERLAYNAKNIGLEVLMEVHSKEELKKINEYVDFVGVNNRNLKTLNIDIDTSIKLSEFIPDGIIKISESGLTSAKEIIKLKKTGYKGFLIGSSLMKSKNPEETLKKLISEL